MSYKRGHGRGRSSIKEPRHYIKQLRDRNDYDYNNRPKCFINGTYDKSIPVVGYCWCKRHRGYLSAKMFSKHQCISKDCPHFQKLEATYWVDKEIVNLDKKIRKILKKTKLFYSRNVAREHCDFNKGEKVYECEKKYYVLQKNEYKKIIEYQKQKENKCREKKKIEENLKKYDTKQRKV